MQVSDDAHSWSTVKTGESSGSTAGLETYDFSDTNARYVRMPRALWRRRVVAGLGAYWIYQHLGNLPPAELADDPLLAKLRAANGDAGDILDEFAWTADREPERNPWGYARGYGRTRIIILDSRCARVFTPGRRAMLGPAEWAWFDNLATGDVDHLVIGSSLPHRSACAGKLE